MLVGQNRLVTARPATHGGAMPASMELAMRELRDVAAGSFRCKTVRQSRGFLPGQTLVRDIYYRASDGIFSLRFKGTDSGLLRLAFVQGEGRASTEGLW
jgi:hypothetical protein